MRYYGQLIELWLGLFQYTPEGKGQASGKSTQAIIKGGKTLPELAHTFCKGRRGWDQKQRGYHQENESKGNGRQYADDTDGQEGKPNYAENKSDHFLLSPISSCSD